MSEFIEIGTLLGGRYEIVEKIGSGGMADVYKAHCRLLNRSVAIKALKSEFAGDNEFLKRFDVEAQAAASLSHPNIVSVYDVGFDAGRHYIVMELVEGVTLKAYIAKKGALPWREAAGFAAQICSALECAHRKRIIHRDIKPHNIIITPEGVAKVTDFGIARAAGGSTMVADGAVMGSAHYLSPEQARGGYVDEKSDIYSAGVTLYEMLTGRVPYEADSPVSVAMMHVSGEATPPRIVNPDIPEGMEQIVLKAMSKEQGSRYQTAGDMLADINAVLADRAISPAPEPTRILDGDGEGAGALRRRGAQMAQKDTKQKKGKNGKEPLTKSEKRMVWLAVVAAVVLIGIVGVVCMSWFGVFGAWQWDETKVPEIEGKTLEEATKLLKDAKLEIDIEEEIASTQYEKDTIISQEPAAGRTVKKGVKVRVKVSSGIGDKISIPNVVNYEKDNAKATLEKAGFTVVFTEEESETVPEGTVIRQSPSAGAEAETGDTVRLYVSAKTDGNKVPVPNVIGKSLAQAKNDIESAGLVVGNVAEQESEQAVGTVIKQSPSNGTKADKKSAVALTVSKGTTATPTPSTPTPTTPTPPTEEPQKVKTISLPVPQNKDSTRIKVVANGKTIHDAVHNKSEVNFDLRVTGRDSATLQIYHDGTLVGTQTVTF